jgi:integrase/recombinase XerD
VDIVPEANGRKPLTVAVADFLEKTKLSKKPTTLAVYRTAIRYFQESCSKQFVDEIERKALIKFAAFLRDDKDQSPRSVYNKFENLMTFLKASGVRGLIGKNDWPRYVEEEPEIYEEADLNVLFATCDSRSEPWFEFFLMTGEREQEVMTTYWTDINFNSCTVRVTHKPDLGWTPKTYKEREIPVPEKLIASLQVTPVLAKHSKPFSLIDCISVGVARTGTSTHAEAAEVSKEIRAYMATAVRQRTSKRAIIPRSSCSRLWQ